jgi:hypothetical protein
MAGFAKPTPLDCTMPDTPPAPYDIRDYDQIIADLVSRGIKDFFKDQDIKKAILLELESYGCKPPFNRITYEAMAKLLELFGSLAYHRGGQTLLITACKWEVFRKLLNWLSGLLSTCQTKDELKRQLLDACKNSDYVVEMKPTELTDLDSLRIIRDEQNHQRIIAELGMVEADLKALIDSLPSVLNAPSVYDPRLERKAQDTPFQSLYFGRQYDAFQGRKADHEFLKAFLNDEDVGSNDKENAWGETAFRWQLIYGDGGMGKSRLALELLHTPSELWRGGFLFLNDLNLKDVNKWRPSTHTLLVIDYAATRAEQIGQVIFSLKVASKDYDFKVRLLLLERSANEDWLGRLFNIIGGTEYIRAAQYQAHYPLGPLEGQEMAVMITQRLAQREVTHTYADEALISKLYEIDPKGRPLFAAILAEALSDGQDLNSLKRDTLLSETLNRERDKHWLERGEEADKSNAYMRHANLMCLATLTFVLRRDQIGEADIETLGLPRIGALKPEPFDAKRMRRMSGYEMETKTVRPLEPDLLGELFALNWLKAKEADERQALIDAAWRLSPDDMGGFMVRAARDYGDLLLELNSLPPTMSERDLVVSFANYSIGVIQSTSPLALSRLVSKLTRDLCAQYPTEPAVREEAAKGAFNLINAEGTAQEMDRARHLFDYLKTLSAQYPTEPAVREWAAKGAVNLIIYEGRAQEMDRARHLFDYLKTLSAQYPTEPAVREEAAKGAVNLIIDEGRAGNLEAVKALHSDLLSFGRDYLDVLFTSLYNSPFSDYEAWLRSQGWL